VTECLYSHGRSFRLYFVAFTLLPLFSLHFPLFYYRVSCFSSQQALINAIPRVNYLSLLRISVQSNNFIIAIFLFCSRDSLVGVVTKLRPGRPGFDSQQEQERDFSFLHSDQNGCVVHPASYPMCTAVFIPGVKAAGA
jgi:hypothetical protein